MGSNACRLSPEAPMNDGNNYNCPKVLGLSLLMIREGLGQLYVDKQAITLREKVAAQSIKIDCPKYLTICWKICG